MDMEHLNVPDGDGPNGSESIHALVDQTQTFSPDDPGSKVHKFFNEHSTAEGVVILEGEEPVGLVMRNDFYQKLGAMYGRDLFIRRPLKLVMTTNPLIVDVSVSIPAIGLIAMNRDQNQLYDLVIVTENEKYLGVVSIKRFMIELSKDKEKEIKLLTQQKELLHRANEAEVEHRKQIESINNKLSEVNQAVKNLLDNAGQGFLSFGPDLSVSEEYSLECVQLFRGPIGGKNFIELIARHVKDDAKATMEQVFGNVLTLDKPIKQKVYLSLLPDEINVYERVVHVQYKIIGDKSDKRMMLVLTDITETKRLQRERKEERKNLAMVIKSLSHQAEVNEAINGFQAFVSEAPDLVENVDPEECLAELFRTMHTYKGDFAQLGLHATSDGLHVVEDALAEMTERDQAPDKSELAAVVREWNADAILQQDISIIEASLGREFFDKDEQVRVSKESIRKLEERVNSLLKGDKRDEMLHTLRAMRFSNLKELMGPFRDYAQGLAGRLEKAVDPLDIYGADVLVDKDVYTPFIKSLVHVIRNMVDHGIEDVEERVMAGKPEFGRISCKIKLRDGGGFAIAIKDDGRGIDTFRVKARALEKGLVTQEQVESMKDSDVFELLFSDAFSTKEEVTAISGRGVGLAAVRSELEKLGGYAKVKSIPGQRSKFTFELKPNKESAIHG